MESFALPLRRLAEDAAWFTRATETRVLFVRLEEDLRKPALTVLQYQEYHADNFSPWMLLQDAYQRREHGWVARASRLVKEHEARRQALLASGTELGPVTLDASSSAHPLAVFGTVVARVTAAQRPPLSGVVVILAPTLIEDASSYHAELATLVGSRGMENVRWVLVEPARAQPPEWLRTLGARAVLSTCVTEAGAAERDIRALLESEKTVGRPFGRIGPRDVVRPVRVDDPPVASKDQVAADLGKAGVPSGLGGDFGAKTRASLLGAALAMREKRGEDAIRLQRQARDQFREAGLLREAVIAQITLGSYLLALGEGRLGTRELERAVDDARTHRLDAQEAQARLALGMWLAQQKRPIDAATHYAEGARAAERADEPMLAIESWRLAGQLALDARAEKQAATAFKEALRVANASPPEALAASSAPLAARLLAELCRTRGLHEQAQTLLQQAVLYERGASAGQGVR